MTPEADIRESGDRLQRKTESPIPADSTIRQLHPDLSAYASDTTPRAADESAQLKRGRGTSTPSTGEGRCSKNPGRIQDRWRGHGGSPYGKLSGGMGRATAAGGGRGVRRSA
eukprot:gene17439-biopygen9392